MSSLRASSPSHSVSPSVEQRRIKDDRQSTVTQFVSVSCQVTDITMNLLNSIILLDELRSQAKENPMENVKQKDVIFPSPYKEKEV